MNICLDKFRNDLKKLILASAKETTFIELFLEEDCDVHYWAGIYDRVFFKGRVPTNDEINAVFNMKKLKEGLNRDQKKKEGDHPPRLRKTRIRKEN